MTTCFMPGCENEREGSNYCKGHRIHARNWNQRESKDRIHELDDIENGFALPERDRDAILRERRRARGDNDNYYIRHPSTVGALRV